MSKPGEKDTNDDGSYAELSRSGLTRASSVRRPEGGTSTSRSMTVSEIARAQLARTPSEPAMEAAARAILSAVGLERGTLALVVELGREKLGSALQRTAESLGLAVEAYLVDRARLGSDAFVSRLAGSLSDVDGAIYVAGPTGIAPPVRAALFRNGGTRRDALLLGIDERVGLSNLGALSRELESIGSRIEARCRSGRELQVEGLGGTELRVATGPSVPWHHDVGRLDGPGLLVLPAGRSIFCPPSLEGTLVPDGGVLLPGDEVRCASTRLRLRFEHGRLVAADGPLGDRVLAAARAVTNGTMIGQVVLGTNPAVLTPVGHEGQDLTTPGLHLVLGDSRPEHTGSAFCAPTGITLGVRRPDVTVDGEPLLVRGRFARSIASVAP